MADGTKIEWADATVNAINGCSLASPGCTNCYAMRLAGTRLRDHPSRKGLTVPSKAGPVWNGTVRLSESALLQPLKWRAPRAIFWNAHGDTFHEAVPDAWNDHMFAVMALTPQHKHLVLTKRSARMREYVTRMHRMSCNIGGAAYDLALEADAKQNGTVRETYPARAAEKRQKALDQLCEGLPNVWLGVSVEDQKRADERIPDLLATPAAGRFLSCEPLLGPIDLGDIAIGARANGVRLNALTGCEWDELGGRDDGPALDGIIVGGESGPGARPMHPEWARDLRNQCATADVDFHFKQWGEWKPNGSVDIYRHGPDSNQRQYPNADGVSLLRDGRICCRDFTVAEHQRRIASGAASSTRAVEVGFGALDDFHATLDGPGPVNPLGYQWMYRIGKKAAGRELDGVTHDVLPWQRAS